MWSLNGHDHDYDASRRRIRMENSTETAAFESLLLDSGGKDSHRVFGPTKPNSEERNDDTYGVLKLTLHAKSYDWEFVPEAVRGC